jgi:hypothetical protein
MSPATSWRSAGTSSTGSGRVADAPPSLDRLGAGWWMCRPNLLAVAGKDGVGVLDAHVGARH